jgi:hypothetical protein
MTKSTITRDDLNEVIATYGKHHIAHRMANVLLAAMDSEPDCKERKLFCSTDTTRMRKTISVSAGAEDAPLYRHAQQSVVPASQKEPISFDEWSRKCALQITLCYPDFREKAKYIWDSARETQQPAPVVPDGYVMVPKEPTDEMLAAAKEWTGLTSTEEVVYIKMLAAAPQSPGSEPATVPGKWIPVSERMPDENAEQQVLACFKGGDISTLYYFEGRWDDAYGIVPIRQDVTHWMPLPAAPKEVKGE